MHHASAETIAQVLAAMGMLIGMVIAAVLIVQRFRGNTVRSGNPTSELISNFQEMRSRGDITDADYRKIKSVLGDQLHGDVKDGKDKL
jgi:uncharacterized membrane protein